jgi:hypothetical protein
MIQSGEKYLQYSQLIRCTHETKREVNVEKTKYVFRSRHQDVSAGNLIHVIQSVV